jgi:hypothetical protein
MKPRESLRTLLFLFFLVLYSVFFYWGLLTRAETYTYRDLLSFVLPMEHAVRVLSTFDWPALWNPWQVLGKPLAADILMGVFYPINWMTRFLPEPLGYNTSIVLHHIIPAFGMYALLKRCGLGRMAAGFGGFVCSFAGPGASVDNMMNTLHSAAWIPWSLWAAHRIFEKFNFERVAALALFMGLTFLGGVPELFALTLVVILLAGLLFSSSQSRITYLSSVFLAVLLASGLIAVQLIPLIDLLLDSPRMSGLNPASTLRFSQNPLSLIGLIFARDYTGTRPEIINLPMFWEGELSEAPWNLSLYYGISLAFVLLAGLNRSLRTLVAAAVLMLFPLVLSFGAHLPGIDQLISAAPFLQAVRYPEKALLLFHYLCCMGIAYGVDSIAKKNRSHIILARIGLLFVGLGGIASIASPPFTDLFREQARGLVVAAALFTVIAAFLKTIPRTATLALLALCVAQITAAHQEMLPQLPWREIVKPPLALQQLPPSESPLRIYANNSQLIEHQNIFDEVRLKRNLAAYSLGQFHGIANVNMPGSINTRDMERLNAMIEALAPAKRPAFLAAMSVQYVSSLPVLEYAGLTPIHTRTSPKDANWYKVESALPRAYIANRIISGLSAQELEGRMLHDGLEPGQALLENAIDIPTEVGSYEVTMLRYAPMEIQLEVRAGLAKKLLVLNDTYDKDWQASINDQPTEIYRVNQFVRGVVVPAGVSKVVFVYRPASVMVGMWCSIITILVTLVGLALLPRGNIPLSSPIKVAPKF